MKIHPSAHVAPGARLHESVEIGPNAIIGDEVALGAGCVVKANAVIEGQTTLGENNIVGYGAVIGAPPQDFAWKPDVRSEVRIGNHNTFREYVTIHRGTKEGTSTIVGDHCYLMVNAHLGHNVKIGNKVIIANNCPLGGYAEVEDGAVLGGGSVFHQHIRVGRMAMVRGGTGFSKDIPPFATTNLNNFLAGVNVIGLRRAGVNAQGRAEVKAAYKLLYHSGVNISQALVMAKEQTWGPEAQYVFDFVAASKKGVCAMRKRGISIGNSQPELEDED